MDHFDGPHSLHRCYLCERHTVGLTSTDPAATLRRLNAFQQESSTRTVLGARARRLGSAAQQQPASPAGSPAVQRCGSPHPEPQRPRRKTPRPTPTASAAAPSGECRGLAARPPAREAPRRPPPRAPAWAWAPGACRRAGLRAWPRCRAAEQAEQRASALER
ncbi:hypothetical protein BDA96_06G136500 [Sorghum bicolor]|uniref:Uncharacterized protein n=2 Tax=Sorghum bicolor TaxID=4558 RepID=A0A921QQA1_SORBI|nr:hypothetical protein BDA96_06G136500 [Sorghum bicolor]OQU81811.1 hypothetical protein SORBI_3006G123650 [Sorghum bicolor]